MRSLRWLLVPATIAIIVAGITLGFASNWINSIVGTDAFRHQIESRAGQTIGGKVVIREIGFSLWRGITLSGVATKFHTAQGTLVSTVERVNCSVSMFGLLRHRLQLDGLNLVEPDVVLTQEPPSNVPTPAPPPVSDKDAADTTKDRNGPTPQFQVVVESARVTDGHLSIRDASGAAKADLHGVQVGAEVGGFFSQTISGKIRVANVTLPKNMMLTDFSTPFHYQSGTIDARPFKSTAFRGELTGGYHLEPTGLSLLELEATGIDVSQIGGTAEHAPPSKLSGSLALQSKWHGVETGKLAGEGDAQITGGKLRGVTILDVLSTTLRVRGLHDPDLKTVSVHFQVSDGVTHFSNLVIESEDFGLAGEGVINASGGLSASMVLTLHGRAMGGVPGAAASLFSMLPVGGGSIPFHLSGTVQNPHADLSSLLLMPGVKVEKSLGHAIGHFFH